MRTFKNYMEAAKARKLEETGEEGFSLIELIVVVVILGILAAVAIPIFLNIQAEARTSAGKAAAANGATQAAAALAKDPTAAVSLDNLKSADVTALAFQWTTPNIDTICVTATIPNGKVTSWSAGPGAKTDGSACK